MGNVDPGSGGAGGLRALGEAHRWHRSTTSRGSLVGASGDSRVRLRRRGPGEDSTGRQGAARRFRHTPLEYRCVARRSDRRGRARRIGQVDHADAKATFERSTDPQTCLTPLSNGAYHPPDDDAPCALSARRVCVPSGVVTDRPRGRMERIPDSPDDQADLSAKEAPPRQGARLSCPDEVGRWPTDPGRPSGSRS